MRTTTAPTFSRRDRRRIAAAGLLTLAVGVGNVVTSGNAHAAPRPLSPSPTIVLPPVTFVPPTVPPITIPPVITLPPIDPCILHHDCDEDPPIATPPLDPCLRPDAPPSRCPGKPEDPGDPGKPQDPGDPGKPQDPGDPGKPQEPGDPGKPQDQPKASVDQAIPARPTFTG